MLKLHRMFSGSGCIFDLTLTLVLRYRLGKGGPSVVILPFCCGMNTPQTLECIIRLYMNMCMIFQ